MAERSWAPWSSLPAIDLACVCLAGEDSSQGKAPDTESFEEVLKKEIKKLEQEERVPSVASSVDNIQEGQQVTCNGELRSFRTFVAAELGVDESTISDEKKEELERKFRNSYNNIAFDACDRFFRVVSIPSDVVRVVFPSPVVIDLFNYHLWLRIFQGGRTDYHVTI